MIDGPLRWLLRWLDVSSDPTLTFDDFRRWPPGTIERFTAMGLLRELPLAESVYCDGCDDQDRVEIELQESPANGQVVAVGRCRECGRIEVDLQRLRQFEVRLEGLAKLIASSLGLSAPIAEDVRGRAWFIGTLETSGRLHDVFLGRGVAVPRGMASFEQGSRYQASNHPIVLVPARLPPARSWRQIPTAVLSIFEMLRQDDRGLNLDWNKDLWLALQSLLADRPGSVASGEFGAELALAQVSQASRTANMLTVTQCAELLMSDVSGLDIRKAKARVSKAASAGKFRTNGKMGSDRRIDRDSFSTWRIEQRERDLDCDEDRD